jgi:hydroxymethylglutaryl-CoA reductase
MFVGGKTQMEPTPKSSRLAGFYKLSIDERLAAVQAFANLTAAQVDTLRGNAALNLAKADKMIENVGGLYQLPIGFACNFRIDGQDRILPMVIEEPSVVAASSHAAKLLRQGEGIQTASSDPIMVGQIQLLDIADLGPASERILAAQPRLLEAANACQPRLVARGGGARRLSVRAFPGTAVGNMLVVHLHIDVCDAMGANLVNTMVETIAPECERLSGGRAVLRILSNLADERLVTAVGRVPTEWLARPELGMTGAEVASRVEEASVFAEVDPYRAATHNKGIMNGVDAFLIATGQDWRAVEAGAHAYAAREGRYGAMATWRHEHGELVGRMTLPMQVGTVGGVLRVHPVVDVLLQVAGVSSACELGSLAAAAGLAQNLAAILALATEGIQKGHMSLHARNIAASVGAKDQEVDRLVEEMIRRNAINRETAQLLYSQLCQCPEVLA